MREQLFNLYCGSNNVEGSKGSLVRADISRSNVCSAQIQRMMDYVVSEPACVGVEFQLEIDGELWYVQKAEYRFESV